MGNADVCDYWREVAGTSVLPNKKALYLVAKCDSFVKTLMLIKIEGGRRRG